GMGRYTPSPSVFNTSSEIDEYVSQTIVGNYSKTEKYLLELLKLRSEDYETFRDPNRPITHFIYLMCQRISDVSHQLLVLLHCFDYAWLNKSDSAAYVLKPCSQYEDDVRQNFVLPGHVRLIKELIQNVGKNQLAELKSFDAVNSFIIVDDNDQPFGELNHSMIETTNVPESDSELLDNESNESNSDDLLTNELLDNESNESNSDDLLTNELLDNESNE
ncbi:7184_t:CDS:2, partial [Racocetra fulgida]